MDKKNIKQETMDLGHDSKIQEIKKSSKEKSNYLNSKKYFDYIHLTFLFLLQVVYGEFFFKI